MPFPVNFTKAKFLFSKFFPVIMTDVFIIHGTHGYPDENWFPWLKKEVEKKGHKAFIPSFPTPENQSLESWFDVFNNYIKDYTSNSILVGHSLGGAFALRVLERFNIKIKSAYIVAAPCNKVPSNFPGANLTDLPFVGQRFNWEKIKSRANKFYIFHSDNDPYIDIENSKEIAKQLNEKVILIPNSGHFNAKAGYLKFEKILDLIKNEL